MDRKLSPPQAAAAVATHYAALTDYMVQYAGDLLACHFGLWGPDTKTDEDSILRANQALVQGCGLTPGQRVLDAGCGIGGTAISLAEQHGVQVTGLTICKPHIAVAEEHARQRGVDDLVDFVAGDFMELPFPDANFDLVLNHESFCYASDKLAYLRGVHRVLKPGARWQALEGLTSGTPMSEAQKTMHAVAQSGWCMPPLEPWRDVLATMKEAGFEQIRGQDLTSEVMPATEKLCKRWQMFTFLIPRSAWPNQTSQEFMEATINYHRGLREGVFTFHFLSAVKPA